MAFTPKQQRNGVDRPPRPGPGPQSSADVAEVQAAFNTAMADSGVRQAQTREWLGRPLAAPQPSGDRLLPAPGQSGYAGGEVLGVGQHPGQDLLPPATTNPRLPSPQPAPAPVSTSAVRPPLEAGFWEGRDQADGGPQYVTVGVSPDIGPPARRGGGVLARLARLFRGKGGDGE